MILFSKEIETHYGDYILITEHSFVIKQLLFFEEIMHIFFLKWFLKYIAKEDVSYIAIILSIVTCKDT